MGIRVVHYLNQFFAGAGGEAAAGLPIQVSDGALGPGRLLQRALGAEGVVVGTIVGGDNHVAERSDEAAEAIERALAELRPDVVVAGPAFDSGRYGMACALACLTASRRGVPSVTAMHPDNPGFATHRRELLCVPTGVNVAEMARVVPGLGRLALKLARGEELGPAEAEGYLPRGLRRPIVRDRPGAVRAVDMLVAWLGDRPFASEIPVMTYDQVAPRPPVDPAGLRLAVVTSGGLVPSGNPDHLVSGRATQYFRYSLEGLGTMRLGEWETVHGGYSTEMVNTRNPNYVVPLDALRALEGAHRIGALHPTYYATVGNQTAVADAKRMGAQIAEELLDEKVGAALMVAT
jgi:betaine reductase